MQRDLSGNSAVRLTRLRLQNFRNFEDETLELPPAGAAISGDNGQGKTNLLEAVYYLAMFRSFRGARDDQLVRFGADFFRIEARTVGPHGEEHTVAAGSQPATGERRVAVDGASVSRLADGVGRLPAVIFTGIDVEMVRGAPAQRRRFLDVALSLARPSYLTALQRFRRALGQRNESLRRGASASEVTAWDEALVDWGAEVARERARWVVENAQAFARHYAMIAGEARAGLTYLSGVTPEESDGTEAWRRAYRDALEASRARDRARRWTTVGPHRDDLGIQIEKGGGAPVELRVYASGGEQRTAAIALRLTEAAWLRQVKGHEPIALLDDVFGELDPRRVRGILACLGDRGSGQVIVTAPGPLDWAATGRDLAGFTVQRGRLRSALSAVT